MLSEGLARATYHELLTSDSPSYAKTTTCSGALSIVALYVVVHDSSLILLIFEKTPRFAEDSVQFELRACVREEQRSALTGFALIEGGLP